MEQTIHSSRGASRGRFLGAMAAALFVAFVLLGCHVGGERLNLPFDDGTFLSKERVLIAQNQGGAPRLISYDLERKRVEWSAPADLLIGESISFNDRFAVYAQVSAGTNDMRLVRLDLVRGILTPLDAFFHYETAGNVGRERELVSTYNHISDDGQLIALFVDAELRIHDVSNPRAPVFRASFGELGDTRVRFAPGAAKLFVSIRDAVQRYLYVVERSAAGWSIASPFRGEHARWTTRGLFYLTEGHLRCRAGDRDVSIDPESLYHVFDVTPDGALVGSPAPSGYALYDVEQKRPLPVIPIDVRDFGIDGNTLVAYSKQGDLYRVDLRTNAVKKLRSFGARSRTYRIPIPDMGQGVETSYSELLGPDGRYFLYFDEQSHETYVYDVRAM